jgi:hypothetical protein
MNILMLTENDPAGMGIAFTNAVNRYTDHNCRLITKATRYNFNFDRDIHLPDLKQDEYDLIRQLLADADILHFHILSDESIDLGPIRVKDYAKGRSIVHHHHGHPDFRANPAKYRLKYKRLKRKVLVSTPDLLTLLPEAKWQPNLVPIHDPLYMSQDAPIHGKITICQAATRKDIKNTADLMDVVSKLKPELKTPLLEVKIIENTDHKTCLKIKNKCQIAFDHMQGYYGVSSLESLSQGKAVIAGLDKWNRSCIIDFAQTSKIPWIICRNRTDLAQAIRELHSDSGELEAAGQSSRSFMCNHWSDKKVAGTLCEFYQTL